METKEGRHERPTQSFDPHQRPLLRNSPRCRGHRLVRASPAACCPCVPAEQRGDIDVSDLSKDLSKSYEPTEFSIGRSPRVT